MKSLLDKKLLEFSRRDALGLEEILYTLYTNRKQSGKEYSELQNLLEGSVSNNFDSLLEYLHINRFIRENKNMEEVYEDKYYEITHYKILPKGDIICEQGGIFLLYENSVNQSDSLKTSRLSIGIAFLAVLISMATLVITHICN